jgi:hypothetical protein
MKSLIKSTIITYQLLALLLTFFACSFSASADTYTVTFTADLGSTGGALTVVTSPITSGPITIDWGTDVFSLSALDFADMLSECAPLGATLKGCATYSASDAGISKPKLNVGPLLSIDDDGSTQASFTLSSSSANASCAIQGCSSTGIVSIADLSAVAAPESGTLGMLFSGMLGLALALARKTPV